MEKKTKPPVVAEWLLNKVLPGDSWNTSAGDFEEYFSTLVREKNYHTASIWYWKNILFLAPKKINHSILWSIAMFSNYLKIAFRNILKHKGYSFINIAGLAIGMTCSILIFLWIMDEINYDKFHKKDDVLFSVPAWQHYGGTALPWSGTPPALGPAMEAEIPEIVNYARMESGRGNSLTVGYGNKVFREQVLRADISLLELFSFPLKYGSIEAGLSDPYSVYLTERIAEKYFANEDAVGKVLIIENLYNFTVAGILENIPENSTIRFDILVPLEFTEKLYDQVDYTTTWSNLYCRTYVESIPGASIDAINSKIKDRINEGNGGSEKVIPFLRKYSDIYLHGNTGDGRNIINVRIFAVIAVSVLILACINFVNLSTAQSFKRAREVGLRKVVGAGRKDLIFQFLGEAVSISLIALAIAFALTFLLIPVFNGISGKNISPDEIWSSSTILTMFSIVFTAGILAGSFPAFYLASFRPIKVFKQGAGSGGRSVNYRNILVVLQFAISIGLIISTFIIRNQLNYVDSMDLGLNKEQIIYIPINDTIRNQYDAVKQELLKNPGIEDITFANTLINSIGWNWHNWDWEGRDESEDPLVTNLFSDEDLLKTFNIELKYGKFLENEEEHDQFWSNNVVINETFADIINIDDPIGKQISNGERSYNIIGVVKDFNFKSAFIQIEPLIIAYNPRFFNIIFLKAGPQEMEDVLTDIESVIKTFDPGSPFEYEFLDESYTRLYSSQQRFGTIFRYFAILAIIISCLGLFGLALFVTEQRIKEIGIRKTLGAPVTGIMLLLSGEFIKWILLANLLAWPVAWYYMSGWLSNFAYRFNPGISIFLTACILSILIAFVTVVYQVTRAVIANPIDSLKYE